MAWKHIIRLPSIINGLIPVDVPFNFSSHACWIKLGFRYNDHKILNPIPPKAEALEIDILPIIISKLFTASYNNQIYQKFWPRECNTAAINISMRRIYLVYFCLKQFIALTHFLFLCKKDELSRYFAT